MSSHDAMMVASGITTVLDAVAIGDVRDGGDRLENLEKMVNAVEETQKRGLNRAEHRRHLRCELPHHTTLPLFEKLIDRESVSMVSLMDHSPGQRQYADRSKYRDYYQGKYHLTHDEMDRLKPSRWLWPPPGRSPIGQTIAAMCRARRIALASHDDATEAHVAESHQLGSVIAEFSHHAGRGAGFTSARDARPDGGAEYRARRFPLRQRRRPPAGEPRFAGHPLI
ncbi:metal-dependent hydrolase [Klebsiella pneumoniae]|uniref:Metal-dependent hydrolase n=1 Tax=Klebsiella pneumoniae TaxID=573 RepID=A0A377ZSK6_KLEPN|nr:metal-dependent hydrolase [Klebsiella pneumoniae]